MSGFDQFAFLRSIRDDRRLSVVEKAVAGVSLFGRRNPDTAQCDPSLPTICADSGVKDERTVVKAIETLVSYGYVNVVKVRGQRNKYVLVNQEVPASDAPALKVATLKVPTSHVPTLDVPASGATRVPTSDVGRVPTSDVGRKNQIKNQRRTNKATTKDALNFYDASDGAIADWMQLRKNKKAVVSQSVIDDLKKKADQMRALGHYEWNLEAIMREQVIRNWQGFKPEWVLGKGEPAQPKRNIFAATPATTCMKPIDRHAQARGDAPDPRELFGGLI